MNIAILGLGFSGMFMALSLIEKYIQKNSNQKINENLNLYLFEKNNTNNKDLITQDIRTTALNYQSKIFLESINIWQDIENKLTPIKDIYIADDKSDDMIHFSSQYLDDKYQNFNMGYIINNNIFKEILLGKIKEYSKLYSNIKIFDNTIYTDIDNAKAYNIITYRKNSSKKNGENNNSTTEEQTVKADLTIISDGRNSSSSLAKKKFFSNLIDKDYKQTALTFLISHEKKHENTALEHFTKLGPFASLPTENQNISSIVMSVDSNIAASLMKMLEGGEEMEEEFLSHVKNYLSDFLGNISLASKVTSYKLTSSVARSYYNKSLCLIGDSAHSIHPLAGQGFNLTIKDINILSDEIINIPIYNHTKDNIKYGKYYSSVIDSFNQYQNKREWNNINMQKITDNINSIFLSQNILVRLIRKFGFKFIEKNNFIKRKLIKYAMGINN
ncbi:MAG TPA: FAD-dependent monooxygenase [Candidatus Megaira endosymbiont of Hartmannula sinica]|nr:FAD-dependent monooxygenase [Candidatus Megaera endosymbiont of Hartmannula sinica]